MADKTIGELPGVTSLDSDSLFVAQQQGTASKVTGTQLIQFANVETAAQVLAAQAAAEAAEESETAAEASKQAAQTAAEQYPYIGENGHWYVFSASTGQFVDSGVAAQGPTGPAGGVNSFNGRTGAVMPAAGDYTAAMVGAAQAWDSTKLLGNTPAKSLSSPGWYRICTKTGDSGAGLFHISHSYSSGGPSDLLVYANFAQYGTELSVISSGYYRNVFPIDDLRMTKVDTSNTYHLDIHYAISVRNSVGLDAWVTSASGNFSPQITLQSMTPVDDAPAGETVLITAEWISPPMSIGVEYRTTERYMGKPVYIKLVNCGVFAAPGTTKTVTFDDTGALSHVVDFGGEVLESGSTWAIPTFLFGSNYEDSSIIQVEPRITSGNGIIYLYTKIRDLTSNTSYVWVKYTKNTD